MMIIFNNLIIFFYLYIYIYKKIKNLFLKSLRKIFKTKEKRNIEIRH